MRNWDKAIIAAIKAKDYGKLDYLAACERQSKRIDPLEERRRFVERVYSQTEDGMVALVESGMDCDCVRYEGKVDTYPAVPTLINREIDRRYQSADGPMNVSIAKPSEVKNVHYRSTDLAMRAFEDGHPSTVYMSDF